VYTISPLPCNATVSWTISAPSLASISNTSGSSVTVTKISNGSVILNATVTTNNTCSPNPINVSFTLPIGGTLTQTGTVTTTAQSPSIVRNWGTYNNVPQGSSSAPIIVNMNSSSWVNFIYSSGPVATWFRSGSYYNQITIMPLMPNFFSQNIVFTIESQNECGVNRSNISYFANNFNGPLYRIATSPNPAKGNVTINIISNDESKNLKKSDRPNNLIWLKKIDILDYEGTVVKSYNFNKNTKNYSININGIKKGIYVLRTFDGKNYISDKIQIVE
jgi:hypothetical protein